MKQKFDVTGMTCAACSARVEKSVSSLNGVKNVTVNLLKNSMSVEYEEKSIGVQEIITAVEKSGYGAAVSGEFDLMHREKTNKENNHDAAESEQTKMLKRLIISAVFAIILSYIAMGHMFNLPLPPFFHGHRNMGIFALTQLLLALPIMAVNYKYYKNGFGSLLHGSPNMDTLIAVGSGASFIYGIYALYGIMYGYSINDLSVVQSYGENMYFETVGMILTLITLGKYFESRAKRKTTDAIMSLMDMSPKTAVVIRDGKEFEISADKIQIGDILSVKAGSIIPTDGVIIEGSASVDESSLTGESIPVERKVGDNVIGATVSKSGYFKMKAEKIGSDTVLSQIIRLVDEATSSKAPIAKLADKVAGIFVPVVMIIAVITAVVWLLLGFGVSHAFTMAVSVLVISCPCALGLATPTAIMVGTGRGTAAGILIKSAEALEIAHNTDTVVLDKTGTVTLGKPDVTDIIPLEGTDKTFLLKCAYSLERLSEHPLADAIVRCAEKENIGYFEISDFAQIQGRGISGKSDGKVYSAGNYAAAEKFIDKKISETAQKLADDGKTTMFFMCDEKLIGIIAVSDRIKSTSAEAVGELKKMGIDVIMLTGDNRRTAKAVGKSVGIEHIVAELYPGDKEKEVSKLIDHGKCVAMVGDGINDAPALARANIGIAIGAGTDIAMESSDIVLMKSDLYDVVNAIRLSRAVMRNIKQNLFWAFFYNIIGIPIASGVFYSFGLMLNPMIGALAMSLSSVCVVSNALRLRRFKMKKPVSIENDVQNVKEVKTMENKTTLSVEGMMCMHCVSHVKEALEKIDGVTEAEVDLDKKTAVVTLNGNVPADTLISAVEGAGYKASVKE